MLYAELLIGRNMHGAGSAVLVAAEFVEWEGVGGTLAKKNHTRGFSFLRYLSTYNCVPVLVQFMAGHFVALLSSLSTLSVGDIFEYNESCCYLT